MILIWSCKLQLYYTHTHKQTVVQTRTNSKRTHTHTHTWGERANLNFLCIFHGKAFDRNGIFWQNDDVFSNALCTMRHNFFFWVGGGWLVDCAWNIFGISYLFNFLHVWLFVVVFFFFSCSASQTVNGCEETER